MQLVGREKLLCFLLFHFLGRFSWCKGLTGKTSLRTSTEIHAQFLQFSVRGPSGNKKILLGDFYGLKGTKSHLPAAPILDYNYFRGWVLFPSDPEQARLKGVMPDDEVSDQKDEWLENITLLHPKPALDHMEIKFKVKLWSGQWSL